MTRPAGLRGRRPAVLLDLMLADHLVDPFGAPAYPIDVTGGFEDWGMLGNGPDPTLTVHQPVGDCTFAGRQHLRQCKAACAGLTETWETSNELVTEYLAYDHGQDEGAVIADLLLAWYHAKKILAFARVDHTNAGECDAAMEAFHGLYCGVDLTDDADQLFGEGEPWTTDEGQTPDPDEGHCIVKCKATGPIPQPAGTIGAPDPGTDTWVTWGALQRSTEHWTAACLQEAWVIITEEDAHLVDLPKLQSAIEALGANP